MDKLFLFIILVSFSSLNGQNLVRLENYIQNNLQEHIAKETDKISFLWFPETNNKIEAIAYKNNGKVFILVHALVTNEKNYADNLVVFNEQDMHDILDKQEDFKEKIEKTTFFKGEIISYDYTLSDNCFISLRSRSPKGEILFLWINGKRYKPPYKPFINFIKLALTFKDS